MDENPQSSTNNASSKSNLKGTLIEAFRVLKLSELITVLGIFVFIPGFIIVIDFRKSNVTVHLVTGPRQI